MRDPYSWSFSLGSLLGVSIRVHAFMPLMMIGLVGNMCRGETTPVNTWQDAVLIQVWLFLIVLAHEFGHCFAARAVDGEANEILMWPLGGLASCNVPHTPRANFLCTLGGPAVNVVLVPILILALYCVDPTIRPQFNPFWYPLRIDAAGTFLMTSWEGESILVSSFAAICLAQIFWLNWMLLLFNTVLIGLPFDGGRMLQALIWSRSNYRHGTYCAAMMGFLVMAIFLIVAVVYNQVLLLMLAWYTYASCKQALIDLESSSEDSLFGYDFSQGYTSLEKDEDGQPRAAKQKQQNFVQRWLQKRAARKHQLEKERILAEEVRMDQLLEKIQESGKDSLTDEEKRFLKRVSERYKNKPS
jgi:stage IV sporulation protein FB